MTTHVQIEVYSGQLNEVDFSCRESDGATPIDMTGGTVSLRLWRMGLTPFDVTATTDDPGSTWTNRALGTGSVTLPAVTFPVGLCRYRLTAVTGDDVMTRQADGWAKVLA